MAKKVILAVAGAGKTYHICHKIDPTKKNLILAYTHENIHNIQKELCDAHGCVPELTTIMTFDAFVYHNLIRNRQSRQRLDRHGTIVVGSCETFHHYNVQGVK